MKQILLIILLSASSLSILSAQTDEEEFESGYLYGMSFSETDFAAADFFKMDGSNGEIEVVSIAKGLGLYSIGVSAFDEWRKEYLIWGQTANEKTAGYLFDANSGHLARTIETDRPPLDLQYDMRMRRFYGLRYMPERKGIEIITIVGKTVQIAWQLEGLNYPSVGNMTFDSNLGLYIFTARDKKNQTRLYRVNVNDGQILDQPIVDDYIFNEFQFDLQDSKLYGLARKKTNIAQYFFVEINMLNAYPTIVRPLFGLKSPKLGTSTINQEKGAYYFHGNYDNDSTYQYEVDVIAGSFFSKVKLTETLSELHYDNSAFAMKRFQDVAFNNDNATNWGGISKDSYKSGDSYPLLKGFYIKDKIELEEIDFIPDETIEAVILNAFNQVVTRQKIFLTDATTDNDLLVNNLDTGLYVLKLKTAERTYSQRFVKK